jgi:hypothetical protein
MDICIYIYISGGNLAFCLFTPESTTLNELNVLYYPATGAVFIGGLCMISVIIEIVRTTKSNDHSASFYQRISKKIGVVRTSLMFVTIYFLMWISIDLLLFQLAFDSQNFVISATAWLKCTFITFDKNHPEAWRDTCGNLPKNAIPFDYIMWLNVTICCQSILIAGVYIIAIYSALYEYIWPDSNNLRNKECDPKALGMLESKSIDIGSTSQDKLQKKRSRGSHSSAVVVWIESLSQDKRSLNSFSKSGMARLFFKNNKVGPKKYTNFKNFRRNSDLKIHSDSSKNEPHSSIEVC